MTSPARWHLNEKGDPYRCSASLRACPYGDVARHYSSPEDARVAYEIAMVEKSMPSTASLDEDGRRLLRLPGATDPARTGVSPPAPETTPAPMTDSEIQATKARLRKEIRPGFERVLGLATYSINIHNERSIEAGSIHIVECDTPDARQRERFDAFLAANGFTAQERGRRTSIFAHSPKEGA